MRDQLRPEQQDYKGECKAPGHDTDEDHEAVRERHEASGPVAP